MTDLQTEMLATLQAQYRVNPRRVVPAELLHSQCARWGYTGRDLARRLGVTPKHVCELLATKARITTGIALKLEQVFGIEVAYWQASQMWLDLRLARHVARQRRKSPLE